ncbi:hypothetical protein Hdeb2414_s0010g00329461 [Helianthus debilis subsp. tardiflorus]
MITREKQSKKRVNIVGRLLNVSKSLSFVHCLSQCLSLLICQGQVFFFSYTFNFHYLFFHGLVLFEFVCYISWIFVS